MRRKASPQWSSGASQSSWVAEGVMFQNSAGLGGFYAVAQSRLTLQERAANMDARLLRRQLLQFLLLMVAGWLHRQQSAVIEYLSVENRLLPERLGSWRTFSLLSGGLLPRRRAQWDARRCA